MNNRYLKFVSLILSVVIFAIPLMSCAKGETSVSTLSQEQVADITEMLETIISEQTEESSSDSLPSFESIVTTETIIESATELLNEEVVEKTSEKYTSLVGNMDVFVYGLLINHVLSGYDCFNAAMRLDDGSYVYGIGYTNYDCYFEVVEEVAFIEGYFPCGFVPLIDEPTRLRDIDIDCRGREIINTDIEDEPYSFFFAYDLEEFDDHCVVWNQYLKYGIDENGDIYYDSCEFDGNNYDEKVGSLYSFDDEEIIYDGPYNGYKNVSGESLSSQIDFEELNQQVNELLKQQDSMLSSVDVETCIYTAQSRVNAYLLANQNETFMGFKVEELLKYAENLDPMDTIRITPNGIEIDSLLEEVPEEPSLLVKWLVGINCAIAVIGAIVVPLFIPALKPVCDAVAGASMELCIQVIFEHKTLKNVQWGKVAVAAVSAVAFCFVGLYGSQVFKFFSTAIIGGATSAVFSYLDGKDSQEIINAFVIGAAVSGCMFVAAQGVSKVSAKVIKSSKFLTNLVNKSDGFISEHQVMLFKDPVTKKPWMIEKVLNPRARGAVEYASEALLETSSKKGNVTNVCYYDEAGNIIGKKDAYNMSKSFMSIDSDAEPEVVALLKGKGLSENLELTNGEFEWSKLAEGEYKLEMTPDRDTNFTNAMDSLKKTWGNDQSVFDEQFVNEVDAYLINNNKTISSFNVKDLNNLGYTIHEGKDGVWIVKTGIHEFLKHGGGVLYNEKLNEFFYNYSALDDLARLIPSSITGTLVAA